jgi:hypothetical protein
MNVRVSRVHEGQPRNDTLQANFLTFHSTNLNTPGVGGHIEILEKDSVYLLPCRKGHVESQFSNLGAQLCQDEVLDGHFEIDNRVERFVGVDDTPIHHSICL